MNNSNDFSKEMPKDCIAFRDFLNGFSKLEHAVMVDRIADGCMVTKVTVYNWKRGLARIPALYKAKIEEIAERKIFSDVI